MLNFLTKYFKFKKQIKNHIYVIKYASLLLKKLKKNKPTEILNILTNFNLYKAQKT